MKKELKDYLHLYLGCKVETEGAKIKTLDLTLLDLAINEKIGLTPILRPLSDMSEDEALECWKATDRLHTETLDGWQVVDYYRKNTDFFEAVEFHYLLSKHFDLFKLIESGLAIDKKTLIKNEI